MQSGKIIFAAFIALYAMLCAATLASSLAECLQAVGEAVRGVSVAVGCGG